MSSSEGEGACTSSAWKLAYMLVVSLEYHNWNLTYTTRQASRVGSLKPRPVSLLSLHVNWRSAEDVGNHTKGRPGAPPRTPNLWLRTMDKELGEGPQWARKGPSSLGYLYPRTSQLYWWCWLNPSRVNADKIASRYTVNTPHAAVLCTATCGTSIVGGATLTADV